MTNEFRQVIMDSGLMPPDFIKPGQIHRFPGEGKRNSNRAGWCYLFDDCKGGVYGDWSTGFSEMWRASSKALNNTQRCDIKAKIYEANRKRKRELQKQYIKAAENAQAMWNQSAEALFHSYLKNKRVLPFGIRQRNDLLIIPLYDTDYKIWSYQSIDESGKKLFMKRGKVSGNFYLIGDITDHVYIVEGFATAATLNQVLNIPVVVAFNTGNLKAVALAIYKKYPNIKITIACDNDTKTEGNPGLTKGREAAASIGAALIYPRFDDEDFEGSDFNDYLNAGGVI